MEEKKIDILDSQCVNMYQTHYYSNLVRKQIY